MLVKKQVAVSLITAQTEHFEIIRQHYFKDMAIELGYTMFHWFKPKLVDETPSHEYWQTMFHVFSNSDMRTLVDEFYRIVTQSHSKKEASDLMFAYLSNHGKPDRESEHE